MSRGQILATFIINGDYVCVNETTSPQMLILLVIYIIFTMIICGQTVCVINEYLTDLPPNQDLTKRHFIVGSHAWIEIHVRLLQKMLGPSAFPFWVASGAKR